MSFVLPGETPKKSFKDAIASALAYIKQPCATCGVVDTWLPNGIMPKIKCCGKFVWVSQASFSFIGRTMQITVTEDAQLQHHHCHFPIKVNDKWYTPLYIIGKCCIQPSPNHHIEIST